MLSFGVNFEETIFRRSKILMIFRQKERKYQQTFTKNNVGSNYHASYLCLRHLHGLLLQDVAIINLTCLIVVFITL